MALGRRPDEREPQPGPSARPRRRGPARSGRSPPPRDAAGSPRPSRSPRARRPPGSTRPRRERGRREGRGDGRCRRGSEAHARARAGRRGRAAGPSASTTTAASPTAASRASSDDVDRLVRHGAGVLAGECEEVVEEPAQPLGVGVDVGERLGVGAVGEQVRGVPAQRGDRVSQLVRRVGDEAALGLARLLERGEHAGSASR